MINIILFIVSAYLMVTLFMYFSQRAFIYFPQKGVLETNEPEIEIKSGDLTLRGWVLNEGNDKAIIYFGGNAERVEGNIPAFKETFSDHTVYLMNYRGYGESDGTPTEESLYADAVSIYDFIKPDHIEIFVIGRSLGSGIATYLASVRAVDRLVLVTPFDSMEKIAQQTYKIFPMNILLKDKYDSLSRTGSINAKTMIIIAEQDEIIPRERSDNLVSGFDPDQLEIKIIEGATHNSLSSNPEYYSCLQRFL